MLNFFFQVGHAIRRVVEEDKKRKGGGTQSKLSKKAKLKQVAGEEKLDASTLSKARMPAKHHQEQKDSLDGGNQFTSRSGLAFGENILGASIPTDGSANMMLEPRMFPLSSGGHSMQQFMAVPPSENFLFSGTGQSASDTTQARTTALSSFAPTSASLMDLLNPNGSSSEVSHNSLLNIPPNLTGLSNFAYPNLGTESSNAGAGTPSAASLAPPASAFDNSLASSSLGNLDSRLGIGMSIQSAIQNNEVRNLPRGHQLGRNWMAPSSIGADGSQLTQYSLPPFASPQEDHSPLAHLSSQPWSSNSRNTQSYIDILRDQPGLRDLDFTAMLGTTGGSNIATGFPGNQQSSGVPNLYPPPSRDNHSAGGLTPPE